MNTKNGQTSQKPDPSFPIEEIARYPLPGMAFPASITFSPDDTLIACLWSPVGDLVRQLYAFDPASGAHRLLVTPPGGGITLDNISPEEELRRERQRQLDMGITQYSWADEGFHLLIPLQDGLYIQDSPDASLRLLVAAGQAPLQDAQFSPDGAWVAYIQDAELYIIPTTGGAPRQLTSGARGTATTHGLAEFIAQEEMGRSHGYWWSPDSQSIAFTEVEEKHIPVYRIMHQGKDFTGEGAQEDHRYPFTGQPNCIVRLGVISIQGGQPIWMNLGEGDFYLARVDWFPDGSLSAQVENREQTRLDLLCFDPRSGRRSLLLREESQVWINLHDMFKPLKGDAGFIWASERTGFSHLYLYDWKGHLVRPLTQGDWLVDKIAAVDEANRLVYFTATLETPLEEHLYVVSLDGGAPRRLTLEPGTHSVVCDHNYKTFVDTYHSLTQPPRVILKDLRDGAIIHELFSSQDPCIPRLGLNPPDIVELQNRGGTKLYGAIFKPDARFGAGPFPTIVMVYGGPHGQMVDNSWQTTVSMRAQYLRSAGYLVFALDNRGTPRRGLQFEGTIKNHFGHLEVLDQVDGVHWLVSQGLTNPQRVGIFGWSYGGYMSAMCLAQAPDVFRVAVAGAPVSHFDGYDTHCTERYMGTPHSNPQGYQESSLMHHIGNLRGKLLLVHGLIDENVHFRHTARLINALIRARKQYDLLLFPDERHMPRKLEDRVYMEQVVCGYFEKWL